MKMDPGKVWKRASIIQLIRLLNNCSNSLRRSASLNAPTSIFNVRLVSTSWASTMRLPGLSSYGRESNWLLPRNSFLFLKRIASHESYMHMARERAARLKDAFELPAAPLRLEIPLNENAIAFRGGPLSHKHASDVRCFARAANSSNAPQQANSEQQELQQAIQQAGPSVVDFIRALEQHLQKYPARPPSHKSTALYSGQRKR